MDGCSGAGLRSAPLRVSEGSTTVMRSMSSAARLIAYFRSREGTCARLVVAWTIAGGIAGGGVLIGMLALTGVVQPGVHLFAAQAVFLVGALWGLFHALVLGALGRPEGMSFGRLSLHSFAGLLLAVPALVAGWIVTAGMTLSAALLTSWKLSWLVVAVGSWIAGLAWCVWAGMEGLPALGRAWRRVARWVGPRSIPVLVTIGVLGGIFLWPPPGAIEVKPWLTPAGVVFTGVGAALWIGLPLLRLVHSLGLRIGLISEPAPSEAV